MTVVRIKRSATAAGAPASLANAELAFNETERTLYYGLGDDGVGAALSVIPISGSGMGEKLVPPEMDGTADPGGALITFSYSDHVHPTDDAIAAGDAAVTTAFQAADTVVTTAFQAADTLIRTDFAAADTAVTTAFQAADAGKVSIAGDTMTGPLVLPVAPPTLATHAAHKGYVDAQLTSSSVAPSDADPQPDGTAAPGTLAGYSREDHVHPTDTSIASGDNAVRAEFAAADLLLLPLAGGTVTGSVTFIGPLTTKVTLANDPAAAMEAATMQYVDSAITSVVLPVPADVAPLMDAAIAAIGTSTDYAREDHVHQTDASIATGDAATLAAALAADALVATALQITTGTDDATFVSPLGLRGQLGADAATLVTGVKTVVPAINEIYNTIAQLTGVVIFAGTYDATPLTGGGTFNGQGGIPESAPGPDPLPAASNANHGAYVIVTVAGPGGGINEPAEALGAGDWLVSDGTDWIALMFGYPSQSADSIAVVPPVAGGNNVQVALENIAASVPSFYDPASFTGDGLLLATQLTLATVDGGNF